MSVIYKKTESVVTREIAGEIMLIPVSRNLADMQKIFALDDVSAFIWNMLDGACDLRDIVRAVAGEFDVEEDLAETDTKRFLEELYEAGLVEQG